MICYRCGQDIGDDRRCPICGADMSLFTKIRHISNAYYNEGLQQASVRNMSAAIVSLKASLRFDKTNVNARNLLGLVYYETGEIVEALSEWVISQSYQAKDNLAQKYLEDIHTNKSQLDAINQTIKKYNQALLYCKQDSRDLAIIQLKKVLSLNPKLVKSHQLLSLLYLQEGKLELAKKTLREAGKIASNNTRTLRYLKEVNHQIKESGKKKSSGSDDLISYQSGNETIIMPKRFRESSIPATLGAILGGLAVGVAVTSFLIVPGVRSKAKAEATKQLLSANDTISSNGLTINDLQNKLDSLQSQCDEANANADAVNQRFVVYKNLFDAYTYACSGDIPNAKTIYDTIDSASLDENCKGIYESLHLYVDEAYMTSVYNAGVAAFNANNMEECIANLSKVVSTNKRYQNGNAIFTLAWAHLRLGEQEMGEGGNIEDGKLNLQKALNYSATIQSEFPNSFYATDMGNLITRANAKLQ